MLEGHAEILMEINTLLPFSKQNSFKDHRYVRPSLLTATSSVRSIIPPILKPSLIRDPEELALRKERLEFCMASMTEPGSPMGSSTGGLMSPLGNNGVGRMRLFDDMEDRST